MSIHDRTLPADAPTASGLSLWRAELTDTVRLATPIALTQLGQIAMMTTDLMLLGRLGAEVVAAAALAHTVLFAAFTLGMGLVAAVAPLAAQAFGARDPRGVRRALRVGMWASVMAGVPLTALQFWGTEILQALGQTPENAALAGRYLLGLGWCLIPAWVFMAIRGFMGAVNRPEPALWITLVAIPANFVLAWALIYGELGLPHLDLLGAGIATTFVNIAMCAVALVVCVMRPPFKKYNVLGRFWRFDGPLFRKLLVVGLPISGAYLLEFGVFAAAALLMGTIGTTALAAHQIALQIAAVLFMVPFGISIAATVRVGHAVGRRDADASRRAGFAALSLAAAFMAIMTSVVALARDVLPMMFLGSPTAETAATFELTAMLLLVGMFFFICDGLQTVAAGALRGLNDTRVPLLFAVLSFWVIGFTACWWLGFRMGYGAVGVWIGLTIGIVVYAVLLVLRFHVLTARGYMPEVSHEPSASFH
ncbi:MAG TPA: MATE family efflux transporter [Hyphomicrobiaceae bacterium]|nr:MATE family efflux transporter [Hyphomicrobiaceae bacterium]